MFDDAIPMKLNIKIRKIFTTSVKVHKIMLAAGIFGMNLKSYLEEPVVCPWVSTCMPKFLILMFAFLSLLMPSLWFLSSHFGPTARIIVGAVVGFFILNS